MTHSMIHEITGGPDAGFTCALCGQLFYMWLSSPEQFERWWSAWGERPICSTCWYGGPQCQSLTSDA